MRAHCWLVSLALIASCGGDDGDGVGTPDDWVEIRGLEREDVRGLHVAASGDVYMTAQPTNRLVLRFDGTALAEIRPEIARPGHYLVRDSGGTPYLVTDGIFQRFEGDTTVALGPPMTSPWYAIAGNGALLSANVDNGELHHLAPGAADWTTAPASMPPVVPEGRAYTYTRDGTLYTRARIVPTPDKGILRIGPDGTAMELALPCLRPQCVGDFLFFGGGPPADAVHVMVSRFTSGSATVYRVDGDQLVDVAELPGDGNSYVSSLHHGRDGRLYMVAGPDNLASTPRYLYRLDGDSWRRIAELPGHGEIAVGADGTVYGGFNLNHNAGPALGGFWVLR